MKNLLILIFIFTTYSYGVEYGPNENAVKLIEQKFGFPEKVLYSINGDEFDPSSPGIFAESGDPKKYIMLVYKLSNINYLCIEIEKGEFVRSAISDVSNLFNKNK